MKRKAVYFVLAFMFMATTVLALGCVESQSNRAGESEQAKNIAAPVSSPELKEPGTVWTIEFSGRLTQLIPQAHNETHWTGTGKAQFTLPASGDGDVEGSGPLIDQVSLTSVGSQLTNHGSLKIDGQVKDGVLTFRPKMEWPDSEIKSAVGLETDKKDSESKAKADSKSDPKPDIKDDHKTESEIDGDSESESDTDEDLDSDSDADEQTETEAESNEVEKKDSKLESEKESELDSEKDLQDILSILSGSDELLPVSIELKDGAQKTQRLLAVTGANSSTITSEGTWRITVKKKER